MIGKQRLVLCLFSTGHDVVHWGGVWSSWCLSGLPQKQKS